jgi:hypothetical protein
VNSFVGVDVGDLTGGVFDATTLFEGNNLGCFAFQAVQQGLPSILSGLFQNIAPAIALLNENLTPVTQLLNCPALNYFDQSLFNQFPGYSYTN